MKRLSKLTAARTPISFRMKAHLTAVLLAVGAIVPSQAAGPYIYVANAGEDTVSKIDVSSNTEVARYATWFTSGGTGIYYPGPHSAWWGPAPSRVARDSSGNAYVLDRFFAAHLPVLLKIAPSGGTLGTTTSNSSAALPITDTITSTPPKIDPGEATDVRILWAREIGKPGPVSAGGDENAWGRAACIDTSGALWVGMYNTHRYYKVDPNTGNTLNLSSPILVGHTPYGCQFDANGTLWSLDEHYNLSEINIATGQETPHGHSANGLNYSLAIFNDCVSGHPKIYFSSRDNDSPGNTGKTYTVYDTGTHTLSNAPLSSNYLFASVAIGVDSHGNIISGEWQHTGRVIKTSPTGTIIWDTNAKGSTVPISDLHGIIIDANDDVWAVDLNGNQVVKYSGANGPTGGTRLAVVKVGYMPYTYNNPPPPTCAGTPTPTPTPSPTPTPTVIPTATPCAEAKGEARCLPNGGYSYTFTVTNNSGSDMSRILLTPVQGSTFILSPQLSNLPSPLHNGQSAAVTTIISNVKQGDKVCFFVSLVSDNAPCCTTQVCPTLPRCGVIETVTPPPPTRPQRQAPPARRGKRRP